MTYEEKVEKLKFEIEYHEKEIEKNGLELEKSKAYLKALEEQKIIQEQGSTFDQPN